MKNVRVIIIVFYFLLLSPETSWSCTIFSAKDTKGNIWFGNNEDFSFSFKNYINIFPKTSNTKFGYYTFSRDTPKNGENNMIAGGMNEAGLAYDLNQIALYPVKEMYKKKEFHSGDHAILSHILANFHTVEEVVEFFDEYWFHFGFRNAQMHVADRKGHFAMISPTGNRILTDKPFQVSTNFDICSNADGSSCTRFPVATQILSAREPNLESFTEICRKTAVKGSSTTVYSNVNNLSTGEVTIFFGGDYSNPYQSNIKKLLEKGRTSLLLVDLFPDGAISKLYEAIIKQGERKAFELYKNLNLSNDQKSFLLPNIVYYFTRETRHIAVYPFLNEYLKFNDNDIDLWLIKAVYESQNNDLKKAYETIREFNQTHPDHKSWADDIWDRINSVYPREANFTVTLDGYQNAKSVWLKSLPFSGTIYPIANLAFLKKRNGRWESEFKLDEGIYNYSFIVDGKEVLDNGTEINEVVDLTGSKKKCHQKCVGFSTETYKLTLKVKVPNKEDMIYVVGNQESIFQVPVIMLKKISEYERMITVHVQYPASFEFVTGASEKQGIVKGFENTKSLVVNSGQDLYEYEIVGWKEE